MTRIVCPHCGSVRDASAECTSCGIVFKRYKGSRRRPLDASQYLSDVRRRRVFRIVRWISLAAGVVTLGLLFWGVPVPKDLTNSEAIQSAQTKLFEHQSLVESRRPHTLELNQPELNGWVQTHLILAREPASPSDPEVAAAGSEFSEAVTPVQSTVRDVKIELLEDSLRAHVVFDFHGIDLTLVLTGRLLAENGYLRFEPLSGQLGMLPLPQASLQSAVRRLFDAPENKEKFHLPPEIREIGIRHGKLFLISR